MDIRKITIEEFTEIKQKMQVLINKLEVEAAENKDNPNYSYLEAEKELLKEYLVLQNQLLSFDLSEIPFEAWENMTIVGESDNAIVDFSQTKANLDFNLFEIQFKGNYRGCKVRNIDSLWNLLVDEKSFSDDVIKSNPNLFLSDRFSLEFKEKYYSNNLTLNDVISLSDELILELKTKDFTYRFNSSEPVKELLNYFNIEQVVGLIKYSIADFNNVAKLLSFNEFGYQLENEFKENFKKVISVEDIKKICYETLRYHMIYKQFSLSSSSQFPEDFILANEDIFLINKQNISEELRQKYYNHKLTLIDIINNFETFKDLPIENFMAFSQEEEFFKTLGPGSINKVIVQHRELLEHLMSPNNLNFLNLNNMLRNDEFVSEDFDKTFSELIKRHYFKFLFSSYETDRTNYKLPSWLNSMNYEIVPRYNNIDEMSSYNHKTLLLNESQMRVISHFGIDNIIKFQQETNFFSHDNPNSSFSPIKYFDAFSALLKNNKISVEILKYDYQQFRIYMAQILNEMRSKNYFSDFPNYDFITGEFRKNFSHIFMSLDAPQKLKDAFYGNHITAEFIRKNPEYTKHMTHLDLLFSIKGDFSINITHNLENNENENAMISRNQVPSNFIRFYTTLFGNEELLKLFVTYGSLLEGVKSVTFPSQKSKTEIDNIILNAVYQKILSSPSINHEFLKKSFENEGSTEFFNKFPDLFIDIAEIPIENAEERQIIYDKFYSKKLSYEDIQKYPQLIELLKNKNLTMAFMSSFSTVKIRFNNTIQAGETIPPKGDEQIIDLIGNEMFLKLCAKYGRYLMGTSIDLEIYKKGLNFDQLCIDVEKVIAKNCSWGNTHYEPEDCPEFLIRDFPQLFLSSDAPKELIDLFYKGLWFGAIENHPEWIPYLKGKSLSASIMKNSNYSYTHKKFFELFSEEEILKFGLSKRETVDTMASMRKVELMRAWYDKTGKKFIPDHTVMNNIPFEEADKFLLSGKNWSELMRIESFARNSDFRDVMLKLAYSFGSFDNDQIGHKKIIELLSSVPRHLDKLDNYSLEDYVIKKKNQLPLSKISANNDLEKNIIDTLTKEGYKIDLNKELISQIYRKNEDDSYTLTLLLQNYPKSGILIRKLLESYEIKEILTPVMAHQLFGSFALRYDPDFREFLLENMEQIKNNPDYITHISNIQRQFDKIKIHNRNRTLTMDLAISYVLENKYIEVEIGNKAVADASAIAGYSQEDFSILQKIYNFGKLRVTSSIPKVESVDAEYSYKMLRLDDPMAMVVGTLSNCCQELNGVAEACMEHSMVNNNGRVFVITDKQGAIVAQSWVWRNKGTLCFDNIEIPDKAFQRAEKANSETGREDFAKEIFALYKKAALQLIEKDEMKFKELLQSGKITQEQYDGLRLTKVTVGLGYNDIAEIIRNNIINDDDLAQPIPFEPIFVSRDLYTSDSKVQFVLHETEKQKKYDGETISVHSDEFIEHSNNTFNRELYEQLVQLEMSMKNNNNELKTQVYDSEEDNKIVSSIAFNHDLDPFTTRIIIHPNYAIIYESNQEVIKLGSLLFNLSINVDKTKINIIENIAMQIKLALEQISKDKTIDISLLPPNQLEMYNLAMGIRENNDLERGVGNAK